MLVCRDESDARLGSRRARPMGARRRGVRSVEIEAAGRGRGLEDRACAGSSHHSGSCAGRRGSSSARRRRVETAGPVSGFNLLECADAGQGLLGVSGPASDRAVRDNRVQSQSRCCDVTLGTVAGRLATASSHADHGHARPVAELPQIESIWAAVAAIPVAEQLFDRFTAAVAVRSGGADSSGISVLGSGYKSPALTARLDQSGCRSRAERTCRRPSAAESHF